MYDASSAKKPTPFKSKVYKAMDKTVDTILAPIDKIENMPQDKLAKLYNNFINKLENHDFCIKGEHTEEKVNNKWPKEILNVYFAGRLIMKLYKEELDFVSYLYTFYDFTEETDEAEIKRRDHNVRFEIHNKKDLVNLFSVEYEHSEQRERNTHDGLILYDLMNIANDL